MTLGKCEHQVCWNITINYLGNERKLEKEEHFIINLEKVDEYSNVVIKDPRKEITIIDNGGTYLCKVCGLTNIPVHYVCEYVQMCVNSYLL